MSNVISFAARKAAKLQAAGVVATVASVEPVLPAVMARIESRDQHINTEMNVSDFLPSVNNVGLLALLTTKSSWAASDLIAWAAERNAAVREIINYVDLVSDTPFATDIHVTLNGAQARVWLQIHSPDFARDLRSTALG